MTERWETLLQEAKTKAVSAREIYDQAVEQGRDLTAGEAERFDRLSQEAQSLKGESDKAKASLERMNQVRNLTDSNGNPKRPDGTMVGPGEAGIAYLGLSGARGKALAGSITAGMLPGGTKGINPNGDVLTEVPLDATVVEEGQPATSLFDVVPSRTRSAPVYDYLRQTKRDNQAGIVATGDKKPTSEYQVEKIRGELAVFAHISEAVDTFLMSDNAALQSFIGSEMVYGLRRAAEDAVLNGDGSSGHLAGLLGGSLSGIQSQSYGADKVTTLRQAATKLESLGFATSAFVIRPDDWEAIEVARNSGGSFDLNGPVDRAARKVWGTRVALSSTLPSGTALAFDKSALSIDTDGAVKTDWSNAVSDDFARNQMRLRVESRFNLSVYSPAAVISIEMTSSSV
jgi:HK97 family phage major capsid protein